MGTIGSISDAGIYIALEKGYFAEQGLDVETLVFDSGSKQAAALATGELHVAGGSPSAGFFNAFARGVDIRIVGDKGTHTPGHGYIGFIVRKDVAAQVKADPQRLRGMTLTLPATGGIGAELQMRMLLDKFGLTLKDVNVQIVPYPLVPSALAGRGVHVGLTLEPFATRAIEEGIAEEWIWIDELYPNMIGGVLMFSAQMATGRPALGRRFMVAYIKGLRDFLRAFDGNDTVLRREVVGILTKWTTVKDARLYDRMRVPGFDPNGRVNMESLRHDFEGFVKLGYIERPELIDLSKAVDNSFADHAARVLGFYSG